ncbi:MAG: hypothetical protein GY862_37520 [Gammaproteobacteria bacterium]|nr:hypothetical protein [Gammaproteobacteria bacterium]
MVLRDSVLKSDFSIDTDIRAVMKRGICQVSGIRSSFPKQNVFKVGFEETDCFGNSLRSFPKHGASRDTAENQTWQVSNIGQEDLPGFVPVYNDPWQAFKPKTTLYCKQ